MYEIDIPDDIEICDTITEKPTGQKLKYAEFVRGTLLTDRRFSASSEALEQSMAIREALKEGLGRVPRKYRLHPNDYNLLLEVAKSPQYGAGQNATSGYGQLAYQCLPFIDSIKNAKKVSKLAAVEDADDADEVPAAKSAKKKAVAVEE